MLERLAQLEQNINQMESLRATHAELEFSESVTLRWALRYGLIESIQIVVDTACGICNKNNLGTPKNYGDCLRFLADFKYIPSGLSGTLLKVIGLRNLLIHEYATIDTHRLYDFLDQLDIFRQYAAAVRKYL